jgi:hypothetical protein
MVRLCLDCGDPFYGTGSRCGDCQRSKDRVRNHARGDRYGPEHQAERKQWSELVDAGSVNCCRCGTFIPPGTTWDLDHQEQGTPSLPAHSFCNRSAGGKAAHTSSLP